MSERFFNCHAHCFTYDHVPAHFLSKWIAVSWLLKRRWLRRIIREVPLTGKFGPILQLLMFMLRYLLGLNRSMAIRYLNFIRYGDRNSQEEVIQSMQHYYPKDTGLVLLSMDMEYMGAGAPPVHFDKQLSQLGGIKNKPAWTNTIYPFIFCDPRRIQPLHEREKKVVTNFTGTVFTSKVEEYIRSKVYQGIKIYPALGYYPFDQRMKPVLDFALENNIPIMTHCTIGAVHFKYRLSAEERYHPFLKRTFPDAKPKFFQQYFTHPLNFECLLNNKLLSSYWGADTPDYQQLKICLGHWGSGEDWHNYLDNPWQQTGYRHRNAQWCSLELGNWQTNKNKLFENFSWFSIICDLMRKYDNVYADISYTLNDPTLLPLVKMILETDRKIRSRVLFGTDFYLVAKAISERAFGINVRAALGQGLFRTIAIDNAKRYLSNRFNPL